jgi:hypothetical protein
MRFTAFKAKPSTARDEMETASTATCFVQSALSANDGVKGP